MKTVFYNKVLNNRDIIIKAWLKEIKKVEEDTRHLSHHLSADTNKEFIDVIFSSVQRGDAADEDSTEALNHFARKMMSLGKPLSYITDGLQAFRKTVIEFILKESPEKFSDDLAILLTSVDEWVDPIIRHLVNEYSGNWEQVSTNQRDALQALSAPIIPVLDGVIVMPLIGTIDAERASLIIESLLDGVVTEQAKVVLIDITRVPLADRMVAHYIIQAAEGVRLIGATCIIVGIRPEIAQTIVNSGINLGEFITKRSLQEGFLEALELTHRSIVDREGTKNSIDELIQSLM